MKRSKYSEGQIVKILKEIDSGVTVEEASRQNGVSKATLYKWRAKYGGMDVSELRRLKELEEENGKLKEMFADLSLENKALKYIVEKKSLK